MTERLVLRQGTQFRDDALTIGFISADLRPSAEGGGVTVRLGIAGAEGRTSARLASGESAPLPGGGSLRVAAISFSPDGSESAVSIEIER
ncbi:hypothetical protein [Microbacterium sp. Clip185]|uniref:hypothetical protein n=1 Tax=Microbacterium sp. Clip185 TaxID=3025663 RepID=UPI002365DFE5|nr:hypothetical protein [Microbacterium sp. Clip185]WDG17908.1 hypothetical protein PQV94_14980 [Microbacterium sp. Clip185]